MKHIKIGQYADFVSMTDLTLDTAMNCVYNPAPLSDDDKLAAVERNLDAAYGYYDSVQFRCRYNIRYTTSISPSTTIKIRSIKP